MVYDTLAEAHLQIAELNRQLSNLRTKVEELEGCKAENKACMPLQVPILEHDRPPAHRPHLVRI